MPEALAESKSYLFGGPPTKSLTREGACGILYLKLTSGLGSSHPDSEGSAVARQAKTRAPASEPAPRGGGEIRWVRLPRQDRSRRTLARILDAAEEAISERGAEATNIADITKRARCSTGLFYTRFRDKDELLRCLYERTIGEARATARAVLAPARWTGISPADGIERLARAAVAIYGQRKGILFAFQLQARHDRYLARQIAAWFDELAGLVEGLIESRLDRRVVAAPGATARFAILVVLGLLNQLAWFERVLPARARPEPDDVAREVAGMLAGYFGVTGRMRPARRRS